MTSTRHPAAILAADVAGYSRLMGRTTKAPTNARVRFAGTWRPEDQGAPRPHRQNHRRRPARGVSERRRCGALCRRGPAGDARPRARSARRAAHPVAHGINLGDVIAEGDDIFGDGVNVAARLEALAEPGGICVSGTVRDQIRDKLSYALEDRGEQDPRTSLDPYGSMRCAPKPSPICRRRAFRSRRGVAGAPLAQSRSPRWRCSSPPGALGGFGRRPNLRQRRR